MPSAIRVRRGQNGREGLSKAVRMKVDKLQHDGTGWEAERSWKQEDRYVWLSQQITDSMRTRGHFALSCILGT